MADNVENFYVHLQYYLEKRIEELDLRLSEKIADRDARILIAMTAADKANEKFETSNNQRLTLLNEFRGQAADQAAKYAERAVVDLAFDALEARVDRNESGLTSLLSNVTQLGDLSNRTERVEQRMSAIETIQAKAAGRAIAISGFSALFGGAVVGVIVAVIQRAVGG